MIITSKITNKKYQWIRVPRTGTISYSKLFSEEIYSNYPVLHRHHRYDNFSTCGRCENTVLKLDAFSVIRNPYDRFISSLYFIAERNIYLDKFGNIEDVTCSICEICGNIDIIKNKEKLKMQFFNFYSDENIFYDFLYDNFNKNCELKFDRTFRSVFNTKDPSMVASFFLTQVHWAYHPKVKIFKYEEIYKFNEWIEAELGYDTSKLIRINASRKKELKNIVNIDFTTDKFKKLVKHLFYDDFRYFGYEFPI